MCTKCFHIRNFSSRMKQIMRVTYETWFLWRSTQFCSRVSSHFGYLDTLIWIFIYMNFLDVWCSALLGKDRPRKRIVDKTISFSLFLSTIHNLLKISCPSNKHNYWGGVVVATQVGGVDFRPYTKFGNTQAQCRQHAESSDRCGRPSGDCCRPSAPASPAPSSAGGLAAAPTSSPRFR